MYLLTRSAGGAGIGRLGEDPRRTLDEYRALGFSIRARRLDELEAQPLSDEEILAFCAGEDGFLHVDLELERA